MVDASTFASKNPFPIAEVINAAQQNAQRQMENRDQGNRSLIQGLQAIGQVGQSLLDRRRAMAQALAGAQLYSQTPEGKEMLGTNQVTTGPNGAPVTMNQTASGGSGQSLQPNQSPIDLQTVATAFMGDKPSDVMKQMFEQHKLRVESGLKAQQIMQTGEIGRLLAGLKGNQISVEEANNIRNNITSLEGKKASIIKDFPEVAGTIASNVIPSGWNKKQQAAFNDYKATQTQIEQYHRQLYSGGGGGGAGFNTETGGVSMTTPSGVTFIVNP